MNSDSTESFWEDFRKNGQKVPLGPLLTKHLKHWWWTIPADPWDEEIQDAVQASDAMMVCHCCFEAYAMAPDFCPKCGTAIGPYNNVKPFERIFSLGELFRNGLRSRATSTKRSTVGYILFSILEYGPFSVLYLFRFMKNMPGYRKRRHRARFKNG